MPHVKEVVVCVRIKAYAFLMVDVKEEAVCVRREGVL